MQDQRKLKALAVVMMLLCMAGAWISGQLVAEHAGPWPSLDRAPRSFIRLCGSGADADSGCAAAMKSRWSAVDFTVPFPTRALTIRWSRVVVPVAFIGLAYFVFLGVWFGFAGRPQAWGRWWYLLPLVTVLGGALSSVFFLGVMVFKLESLCTWCLVTHAINGLLLIGTLCLWPRKRGLTDMTTGRSEPDFAADARTALTAGAALKVIGFGMLLIMGLWAYRGAKLETRRHVAKLVPYKKFVKGLENNPAFLVREYYAQPQRPMPERVVNSTAEAGEAEPTLVIFNDFQCPHCACFASKWEKQYRDHWKGPLQVRFRHFPLCRQCNDTVGRPIHPEACQASYAAEAARLQGGDEAFWKMQGLLFAYSRRLGARPYAELAGRIGLDGQRLCEDMDGDAVRQAVAADIALAEALGVRGTPSVFLNGRRVPQFCLNNPVFWEAISLDLKQPATVAACPEPEGEPCGPRCPRKMASIRKDEP